MLTATDRALLHACRAKRHRLTEAQRATKTITRAPWPPEGCSAAQGAELAGAGAITALHIIEAEIRGLAPAHRKTSAASSTLWCYRGGGEARLIAEFDAWLLV